MKKRVLVCLLISVILTLSACSSTENDLNRELNLLDKDGISGYALTERESYLFKTFGMEGNSHIVSFNAPEEAISLHVHVYSMQDGNNWEPIGSGGVSIGNERVPIDHLAGICTMLLNENHVIEYSINCGGIGSYKTKEISMDTDLLGSMKVGLVNFQDIEINKEIPVWMIVYNNAELPASSVEDYFEPLKFEGMDLVQCVTLTFSDKGL